MAGLRISSNTTDDCMGAFVRLCCSKANASFKHIYNIMYYTETSTFYLPREMQRKEKTVHELRTRDAVVNSYTQKYRCL